eukprot:11213921-Lingulodinium_polyedra.AAC.1
MSHNVFAHACCGAISNLLSNSVEWFTNSALLMHSARSQCSWTARDTLSVCVCVCMRTFTSSAHNQHPASSQHPANTPPALH